MFDQYKNKILSFYEEAKRMPTYNEIMKLTGFKSKNAVFKLLNKLVSEGVINKDSNGKLSPGDSYGEINMLSQTVSAGYGAQAEEYLSEGVNLTEWLVGGTAHTAKSFMLTVSGESMIDAGVFDGDTVLVEKVSTYKDGDMVVAQLNEGYTVKYLKHKKVKGSSRLESYLEPANKKFKNIYSTDEDRIQLIGVVKAVIRKL